MENRMFRCTVCGKEFEAKVVDPKEARDLRVNTKPVTCPKCGRSRVEPIKKYH